VRDVPGVNFRVSRLAEPLPEANGITGDGWLQQGMGVVVHNGNG
jgi:hypothetical protein